MSKSIRLDSTLPLSSEFVIDKAAQQITYTKAPPNTNSLSNNVYNINIPSYTSSIGNIITMQASFSCPVTATSFGTVTIAANAANFDTTVAVTANFSLTNNPLSTAIQTYTANIANQTVSQPMLTNLADAFAHYREVSWLTSNTDYENDFSQGTTDVNSTFAPSNTKTFGADTPFCRRSSIRFVPTMPVIAAPAAGATQITAGTLYLDLYQDFEILLGCGDQQLYGFSKLIINIQYIDRLMTSIVKAINTDGTPIAALTFGVPDLTGGSQYIYYRQCAVRETSAKMYRCMTYNVSTFTAGDTAAVAYNPVANPYALPILGPIASPNIILDSIPYGFFIFVSIDAVAPGAPHQYLPISGISINYMDKTSLLSAASTYSLYKLCVANGLNCSFDRFRGKPVQTILPTLPSLINANDAATTTFVAAQTGVYNNLSSSTPNAVPLFIKSSDLSLNDNQNAGQNIRSTFQCNVTYSNNIIGNNGVSAVVTPTLYVVPVTENMLTIDRDQAQLTNNWAMTVPEDVQFVRGGLTWDTFTRTLKNVLTLNVGDIVDQFKHSTWAAGQMTKSEIEQSKLF